MIVCQCAVVRDDEIRSEVRLGATTIALVAMRCGAAAQCGGCTPLVAQLIASEQARAAEGASTTA